MTSLAAVYDDDDRPSRLPPHDLSTESHLLAAVIEVPANLALVMGKLEPRHFYADAHRRIFEAVCELSKAGRAVDYLSVGTWLRDADRLAQIGGVTYLNELVFQAALGNVEELAERIVNLARARELIAIAQNIASEGYTVTADGAQAYIDDAEREIFKLAQRDARVEVASMDVVANEAYHRMLAAEAREGVELPTGLTVLDEKIAGLGRGRVTAFAARPGMGKTALVTGIALSLAGIGETTLILSLEMPRWQLSMRMACARAGVSTYCGLNGWLRAEDRALMLRSNDEIKTLPIWIDETPIAGLSQIRSKARLVEAKTGRRLGAVIIDYIQLIRAPRAKNVSRDEQLSEITAGLKALSKELDCAIVELSQLNREVEKRPNKRPMLSDLRESGGIEQDADDVIFLYRKEYYLKSKTPDRDKGVAELIVAKQRNGPPGKVRVAFDPRSISFFDLSAAHHEDNEDDE